ncbi:hypothetical protein NW761_011704 [Fusarium oxysporum]|nr:hypothetical protein NW761_011704 [Fusarium oxysporum]
MDEKYKPILPQPNVPARPASDIKIVVEESDSRKRRRIARIACNRCRQKKIGCNGARPTCLLCMRANSECVYRVSRDSNWHEQAEVLARLEHSEQQRRLQSDVISLLRSLPKAQAREMLQQLRDNADLPTVLSSMQGSTDSMMRPSDLRTAQAILPPTGSAIEFELTAQNNTVYPKVLPLNISSLMGLLQRRNNGRMRSALSNAANSLPSVFQSHSDRLQLTKPGHSSASSQVLVPRPFLSGQYCDSSLEKLRISYWTKVPVSNKLAATLISFYIETDHKIMGFFDADVFLEDLVECRRRFCSAFLVNAVLCLACVSVSLLQSVTRC